MRIVGFLFLLALLAALCLPSMAVKEAVTVINVRDQADPANNAVGDGITDDTAHIQAAIDAATKDRAKGSCYRVYIPAGTYLLKSSLIINDYNNSLTITGAGSFNGHTPSPTMLKWGGDGGAMLDCKGAFGLHMEDFMLNGDNKCDILIRVNSVPGSAGACWTLERLYLVLAKKGIECGAEKKGCASDMTLIDVAFDHLQYCFHAMEEQNVDFHFIRPNMQNTDIGMYFQSGGAVTCDQFDGAFVGTAIKIDNAAATYVFDGIKVETQLWKGKRTTILNAKGYDGVVSINGLCVTPQDAGENVTPLFILGTYIAVSVTDSAINSRKIAVLTNNGDGNPTWLQFNNCRFNSSDPRNKGVITCDDNSGFELVNCAAGRGMIPTYRVTPKYIGLEIPTEVTATAGGNGVTLTWKDIADETGYRVLRSNFNGGWNDGTQMQVVGKTAANVTTFTDTTAQPNVTYYYRIWGMQDEHHSWPSDPATQVKTLATEMPK